MLKIPKGLKKKKKGKKNKHKEEELFDEAELEQYRKQQQEKAEQGAGEPSEGNDENSEEWKKFKALTSGVDDILKKTQGDLDRIKSTSFFQKKPPGPSTPAPTVPVAPVIVKTEPEVKNWVGFEEGQENREEVKAVNEEEAAAAFPEDERLEEEEEVEESEYEDDQDDIFDTSYVDVVASGEVKLAYVPDSPDEADDGPDPFDTSIVDKVIKVDPAEEKKKKLVSLGCAVEVLTGKVEKVKAAPPPEAVKTVRRRPKPRDLLLGSFDEGNVEVEGEPEPAPKSILDEDPIFEEEPVLGLPPVTPIADRSLVSTPQPQENQQEKTLDLNELLEEFVPTLGETVTDAKLIEPPVEEESDDEFAALAAESLKKQPEKPSRPPRPELPKVPVDEVEDVEDDPFDTSFASQVLPGKYELKLIEKEVLENPSPQVQKIVLDSRIQDALNKSGKKDSIEDFDDSEFDTLRPLETKHRDLLGGSTTDLSKIVQNPIVPASVTEDTNDFADIDPFDTSVVDKIVAPGKTELKFLEKELLEERKPVVEVDDDFDPRAEEKAKAPARPDNLTVGPKRFSVPKVVAFDVKSPSNAPDLLAVDQEESSKVGKPLTPYYPPPGVDPIAPSDDTDPFDTSHVTNCPGTLELKLIEKELSVTETPAPVKPSVVKQPSLSDEDFDPRAGTAAPARDIITGDTCDDSNLHTPVVPRKVSEEEDNPDFDPFDTSIASGLVPGKAEIKILETELIYSKENTVVVNPSAITEALIRKTSQGSQNSPRLSVSDVLENTENIAVKPLTPLAASSSFDLDDSVDPFDTSAISDIVVPGKTELKILESELMLN